MTLKDLCKCVGRCVIFRGRARGESVYRGQRRNLRCVGINFLVELTQIKRSRDDTTAFKEGGATVNDMDGHVMAAAQSVDFAAPVIFRGASERCSA